MVMTGSLVYFSKRSRDQLKAHAENRNEEHRLTQPRCKVSARSPPSSFGYNQKQPWPEPELRPGAEYEKLCSLQPPMGESCSELSGTAGGWRVQAAIDAGAARVLPVPSRDRDPAASTDPSPPPSPPFPAAGIGSLPRRRDGPLSHGLGRHGDGPVTATVISLRVIVLRPNRLRAIRVISLRPATRLR